MIFIQVLISQEQNPKNLIFVLIVVSINIGQINVVSIKKIVEGDLEAKVEAEVKA